MCLMGERERETRPLAQDEEEGTQAIGWRHVVHFLEYYCHASS